MIVINVFKDEKYLQYISLFVLMCGSSAWRSCDLNKQCPSVPTTASKNNDCSVKK